MIDLFAGLVAGRADGVTSPDALQIRCPTAARRTGCRARSSGPGREPVCGRCKTRLPVSGKPVTVTDTTFSAEVERSPLPCSSTCGRRGAGHAG